MPANGARAEDKQQAPHSPVLEEEDLPADLSDAVKDDVLGADLGSDGSQRGGGAGAGVSVRIGPWGRTPDLSLSPAPGLLRTRLSPKAPTQPAKVPKKHYVGLRVRRGGEGDGAWTWGEGRGEKPESHGPSHFIMLFTDVTRVGPHFTDEETESREVKTGSVSYGR